MLPAACRDWWRDLTTIAALLVTEQRSAPARCAAQQALCAGASRAAAAELQPNGEGGAALLSLHVATIRTLCIPAKGMVVVKAVSPYCAGFAEV